MLAGIAYAVLQPSGANFSSLYTINLDTGAATLVGQVGTGFILNGLAAPVGAGPVPEPTTMLLRDGSSWYRGTRAQAQS